MERATGSFISVMDKPPEISESMVYQCRMPSSSNSTVSEHRVVSNQSESLQEEEKCQEEIVKDVCENEKVCAVKNYFKERRINDIFEFFCNQLLATKPDDPIGYLNQLMDRCLVFRSGLLAEAPTVFGESHLMALFNSFDIERKGFLSMELYQEAISTLGLKECNKNIETDCGAVSRDTFIQTAMKTLAEDLLGMLSVPPKITN